MRQRGRFNKKTKWIKHIWLEKETNNKYQRSSTARRCPARRIKWKCNKSSKWVWPIRVNSLLFELGRAIKHWAMCVELRSCLLLYFWQLFWTSPKHPRTYPRVLHSNGSEQKRSKSDVAYCLQRRQDVKPHHVLRTQNSTWFDFGDSKTLSPSSPGNLLFLRGFNACSIFCDMFPYFVIFVFVNMCFIYFVSCCFKPPPLPHVLLCVDGGHAVFDGCTIAAGVFSFV